MAVLQAVWPAQRSFATRQSLTQATSSTFPAVSARKVSKPACSLRASDSFTAGVLAGVAAALASTGGRSGRRTAIAAQPADSLTDEFLDFVGRTGSPAHTVSEAKKRLEKAGFVQLRDDLPWKVERGGKYYVTREGTSICAFVVGGQFDAAEGGVVMAAAHTDSPCLKLRPYSKMPSKAGTLQLGVETYGGGLWHTWFDRPLGAAGKVIVSTENDGMEERLVRISQPLCIIPNLAIHLQTPDERKAFGPNKELELQPILCTPCGQGLAASSESSDESQGDSEEGAGAKPRHHQELLSAVAAAAGTDVDHVLDIDLCLMDSTPPCSVGSFVSTPRIDNVLSTWAAIDAVSAFAEDQDAVTSSCDILLAASFDHEEVGSVSATGADSAVLERWLNQALKALDDKSWPEVASRSFLLSCDCAHGLHPNYLKKHQDQHQPLLGEGVVIKANVNQRYATTPLLAEMVRKVGKKSNVPLQEFVVRNDCPCGSTIGPLLSAQLGVRTVDVGAPQWAMHSIRETAHRNDVPALRDLCLGIFRHFRSVDSSTVCL
eukprot:TRINITY_DN42842_c0_g1_i1.p1 TRINITY_DN42842_c0_g1~~TRINITY_DN42842_c0_g1_i1.p1  ORF type:complete len:567 (+),score=119.15 TRINITY_DN42842_c0_g1_i1:66-1703(+)